MKFRKRTKILLIVQLLLLLFICCTPSKKQIAVSTGLWGPQILWNRIRDFGAVPASFGNLVLLAASAFTALKPQKTCPFVKSGPVFLVICSVMTVIGTSWTGGVVRLEQFPLMPFSFWIYLLNHACVFSLWWTAAGMAALPMLCGRKNGD